VLQAQVYSRRMLLKDFKLLKFLSKVCVFLDRFVIYSTWNEELFKLTLACIYFVFVHL
jgi:recombinational DNA repair protein (RecF pathway)